MNGYEFPIAQSDGVLIRIEVTTIGAVLDEVESTLSFPKPWYLSPEAELRIRCKDGKLVLEYVDIKKE